jgi:ABC-type oligopeptide transport system substrate-binding subunit
VHRTWLWHEDRTPRVRLVANSRYWNRRRGPRLREVVFRNDVPAEQALELVCTTEGEVDLVTEVRPADAERVERSEHAKLVSVDALRALAGVIDRDAEGLPLTDRRARQALSLAVDRDALVSEAFSGHARPLGGLTPPTALTVLHRFGSRLRPYPHDPALARELWRAAGGATSGRPLRVAAPARFERVASCVARDLRTALGLKVEVLVDADDQQREARRALAERTRPRPWDVLLLEHAPQSADAPPHELHRRSPGRTASTAPGPSSPRSTPCTTTSSATRRSCGSCSTPTASTGSSASRRSRSSSAPRTRCTP